MANTCYEKLVSNADRNGFVVYYGHKFPMTKFLHDIDGFAAGLAKLGLKRGDVVTVYLPSCPQGVAAFYACSKLGLIANIVHPLIPLKLLKENLQKVHSKVLLFYDVLVRNEKELSELNQTLVRCSIADYVTVRKAAFALYAKAIGKRLKGVATYKKMSQTIADSAILGDEQDLVCFMHSGGTSGNPKIVKLSNFAFNQTADGIQKMYHPEVDGSKYNLATLPIFHAYGLCAAIHAPLCMGFSLIIVPKFQPKTVRNYFKKYNVFVWSVVPAMLKKMLATKCLDNNGLKGLDVIWCGGDVLDESLVEEVDAILRKYGGAQLMRGYGLTEVCGVCVVNNYDFYRKNSCGKPMSTVKVQIWNDDGMEVPCGSLGEIAVCSQGNMAGYLEGEDCLVQKKDKWVLTGDIGYLDDDGYLYVVDRKKRSLKIAAVNVFPAQIENCVKKLSFVDEACAVGVKVNGKQFVKVFVTLKNPTGNAVVQQQVTKICAENLIRYSVPRFVEVLDKMPRTNLGKVDFKNLEERG